MFRDGQMFRGNFRIAEKEGRLPSRPVAGGASGACGSDGIFQVKMPRGRVIDTTQFGRSTVSLIFRSPATLHRA
jgi:hypothetical protein